MSSIVSSIVALKAPRYSSGARDGGKAMLAGMKALRGKNFGEKGLTCCIEIVRLHARQPVTRNMKLQLTIVTALGLLITPLLSSCSEAEMQQFIELMNTAANTMANAQGTTTDTTTDDTTTTDASYDTTTSGTTYSNTDMAAAYIQARRAEDRRDARRAIMRAHFEEASRQREHERRLQLERMKMMQRAQDARIEAMQRRHRRHH